MSTATTTIPPTPHRHRAIPFTRSLRVEWRKSIDTRAARWLLAAVLLASAVAAIVPIATPHNSAQDLRNYLATMAIGVTLLLPVVSILTFTSEWSQRTALTTFTQDPRRGRVLAAKLTAGVALASIGALVGLGLATAGLKVSETLGRDVSWHVDSAVIIGYALFVVLSSVMGMAFGALLHNSAAAIAAYFVLPTLISLVAVPVAPIRDWVDTATTSERILHADWSGHHAQILTNFAVWIVLPLLAGLTRTMRRDVS